MKDLVIAVTSLVIGYLLEPIRLAITRSVDKPKIKIEIRYWKILQNSQPYAYVLECTIYNDGRTDDHLREIISVVNPDKIETKYYGRNRYIGGSDIKDIIIPAHQAAQFFSDEIWMHDPFNSLKGGDLNELSLNNFKNVQLIFNFAIHPPIKFSLKEDITDSDDSVWAR